MTDPYPEWRQEYLCRFDKVNNDLVCPFCQRDFNRSRAANKEGYFLFHVDHCPSRPKPPPEPINTTRIITKSKWC